MTDFEAHLTRQLAFSLATFGPGERMNGVLDHISKEIVEVRESGGETSEWVDLVILSLDGLLRRLRAMNDGTPNDEIAEIAVNMIVGKQGRNELRVWPDWRTADPDKAIEHDRSGE